MKNSNIALGISIGFIVLAVASYFCEMPVQIKHGCFDKP